MTPEQCRAARKLLAWSLLTAASKSKVYPDNIFLFEKREQLLPPENVAALRHAYETAGVLFEGDASVGLAPPECEEDVAPEQRPAACELPGASQEDPAEPPESPAEGDAVEVPATPAPDPLEAAAVSTHASTGALDDEQDPVETSVSESPPSPKRSEPKPAAAKTRAAKGRSSRPRKGNPKQP